MKFSPRRDSNVTPGATIEKTPEVFKGVSREAFRKFLGLPKTYTGRDTPPSKWKQISEVITSQYHQKIPIKEMIEKS